MIAEISTTPSRRELLDMIGDIVRQAIAVMRALPDPEQRFLSVQSTIHLPMVRSAMEAYGYSTVASHYVPSAAEISEMERTMDVMARLRHEDEGGFRRLWQWAQGMPIWLLAERETVSVKTVRNRLDRSLARLLFLMGGWKLSIEEIVEPRELPVTSFAGERAVDVGAVATASKVFVGGVGFVVGSKRLRRHGHGR
jgi:sarcosine oxidase delta subunit